MLFRSKMKKRFLACFAALTLGSMMFAGCASNTANDNKTNEPSSTPTASAEASPEATPEDTARKGVKISIVGSTTIAEPMEKLV